MAVIAIFCDGTWSTLESGAQTHVARLAGDCAESKTQKIIYVPGVGTGTGMASALGRWLSKVGGGFFGWGLNRNIRIAYLALCKTYQPGDRIMIFGFSRGAYTARSLVGMIRKCGILSDPTPENLRSAFRLYRSRGARNAPDAPHVRAQRRRLSPDYATSAVDAIERADHSYLVRITYLGVWDTVGALGIPALFLGRLAAFWNQRHAFHDTSLTHLVEQARHALALDEKRALFAPALWDNLDASDAGPGLNRGDQSEARRYQQVWFAGNHGIVGGSAAPQGLAAASLAWIFKAACAAGLEVKTGYQIPDTPIDAVVEAPDLYRVHWAYRLLPWLEAWRAGPCAATDLHPTVRLRAVLLTGYRPRSLRKVMPRLFRKP
ncbi:DUF2235 domain-containing protein [Roseobacter denitrificans]|uniref:T6SS Phospholipase effector Tle1-like catalytic domain-containing protein n=1 Tax=Roseobacter denitrificans (strain ATCC 33942 / OCh 114) TaxID=375451 RepID=Q169E0_ROSDO|nr:DUF2235 domain-containing protein [Roseobacter denitrificans]ABG31403.1 conserved hypothetical protein [Roseobacter denitrificans OCh 114]AVL54423.1 DUF2235 domain-containing protein [Roseobacter denitrificans]SFG00703.1 Uncharacterized protein, PA2063/DUF2235 family [Roseobacter denitrificans OCh 114]